MHIQDFVAEGGRRLIIMEKQKAGFITSLAPGAFNSTSPSPLIPTEDELRALANLRTASEKTPAAMQAASSAMQAVMDFKTMRVVDSTQLRVRSAVRPPNFLGFGAEPVNAVPPAAPPVADGEGSSERLLGLREVVDASAEPARSLIASIATEVRAMPETALLAVPKPSLRALLRNDVAHPAEILPTVLSLEILGGEEEGKEGGTADAAMGELRKQYERHKEMLTSPAITTSGAREAFALQKAIAEAAVKAAAAAAAKGGGGEGDAADAGGASSVPPAALAARPKLTALYILHGPNRKHRQAHLRELLGMLNVQQHDALPMAQLADELRLSEWLCHALAEMPYDKEPDVLGLICQANRMLSLDAEPTLAAAGLLLGDEAETQPKPIPVLEAAARALNGAQVESLQRACHLCAVVGLAHVLKQQLKRAFGISDLRLQAYDPLAELKVTERQVARLANVPPLDTSAMWQLSSAADAGAPAVKKPRKSDGASRLAAPVAAPVAAEGVELAVAQYVWLRALLADDEAGFDFNLLLASPKDKDADAESKPARGAGRKSTAAAKQSAAVKRGTGTPGSSGGRASGGRGSGGRGSGARGRGGRGKKPGRKRKAASSDDEDDEDDDDDDDDLD